MIIQHVCSKLRQPLMAGVLVLLCISMAGCGKRLYGLALYNDSSTERIKDSTIKYGDQVLIYGNVVTDSSRAYGAVAMPIPKSATVLWDYDSGKHCEKTVSVQDKIKNPASFEGHIIFKLKPDGNVDVEITD